MQILSIIGGCFAVMVSLFMLVVGWDMRRDLEGVYWALAPLLFIMGLTGAVLVLAGGVEI